MSWTRTGRADKHQLEQLVAKIQPNDSMVEVERYLREILGAEGAAGNRAVAIDGAECVVLWANLSPAATELLGALAADERIVICSTDVVRYSVAGRALDLPILPPPPYDPLEREHWLPVVFYPAKNAPGGPMVNLSEQGR